jgi:plasmid replication initiation protein
MRFNPDIWKDIAQLTSNYTSYSIEYLLMMQSTYSMRIYEIVLSYDNGDRNYGYTNGIVFEPITKEVRRKFPEKYDALEGYKFKMFDMEEFCGLTTNLFAVPVFENMNFFIFSLSIKQQKK